MLIVCPACASEYRIETDRVGAAGRSVRCAACRETWFITPEAVAEAQRAEAGEARIADDRSPPVEGWDAPPPSEPAGAAEEAAPVIDQPAPPPRRPARSPSEARRASKPRSKTFSPALAAGLAACALLPLALLGRATVVRAMPQTAGLFATIGLPVNLRGIDLRDIAAFRNAAEGDRPAQLVVEGDLVGVAKSAAAVPPIEIEVRDERGQPLYRWSVPAPRAVLGEGERARFRASLSAPPAQGRGVEVRFAALPADGASAAPEAPHAAQR